MVNCLFWCQIISMACLTRPRLYQIVSMLWDNSLRARRLFCQWGINLTGILISDETMHRSISQSRLYIVSQCVCVINSHSCVSTTSLLGHLFIYFLCIIKKYRGHRYTVEHYRIYFIFDNISRLIMCRVTIIAQSILLVNMSWFIHAFYIFILFLTTKLQVEFC